MPVILQLTRNLAQRPAPVAVVGIRLRHFSGPADIEHWLTLRRLAFARQKLGVRDWDAADFAREFLEKPWWRPECMWFAEAERPDTQTPTPVGTVTLARRGAQEDARPVVHWLAVISSYRRRGVGALLMATLEAAVWDAGGRQVWLETHAQWSEAAQLYQSLGYEPAEA